MAKFLSRDQLYRLLQRELPEGVYPDGAPSAFFSTADMASIADVAATGYGNLERIYDNYFPQFTDEFIDKWVDKMFVGVSFDASVSLQDKRDRVIAKVRKQPQITLWEVLKIAASYVPSGTYVQIVENCSPFGTWILGKSRLGKDTVLGYNHKFGDLGVPTDEWCSFLAGLDGWKLGQSKLGSTTKLAKYSFLSIIEPQLKAYGYKLRIYDYQVTGTSFAQMIRNINEAEPARSVHIIQQPLSLSGSGLATVIPNVDQFSLVNCITQDASSDTGYTGRV